MTIVVTICSRSRSQRRRDYATVVATLIDNGGDGGVVSGDIRRAVRKWLTGDKFVVFQLFL